MSASSMDLAMLQSMPGIAYATDRDGRALFANAAFLALVGLTSEEVIGRPLQDVLPLPLVADALQHEEQAERAAMGLSRQIEVRGLFAVDRTWLVTKFPLRSEGELIGIGTIVADITDQAREGVMARREASFIREVLERVPNLIYAKDRHYRFTLANRAIAELYGCSPEEMLGRTERELLALEQEAASSESLDARVLEGGTELLAPEEPRHDSKGGKHWFRTTRQPLSIETTEVEQLLGVATDITEYRNAQRAQLQLKEERMEAIGRLAGGIAHDLNNVLTVLQSGALILKESMAPDAELSFIVDDIARASARAASLTGQLLAYSRQQLLRPKRIDINQAVSANVEELRLVLGDAVHLRLSLGDGILPVLFDDASLGQILRNLAQNARDAMPGGGALHIETRRTIAPLPGVGDADVVELVIEDTGHGIAEEVQDRIFEPFFTTKPQGQGAGLGLAVVYGVVRQSGGDVVVTSEEGQGARFVVRLPVVGDTEAS